MRKQMDEMKVDLAAKLVPFIKNVKVIDKYDWFRLRHGPVLIPIDGRFFSGFIEEIMSSDQAQNTDLFDKVRTKDMRIDLLEVVALLEEVLLAFDEERREQLNF